LGWSSRRYAGQRSIEVGEHVIGDVETRGKAERGTSVHQDVRAPAFHCRLQQWHELRVDLLADIRLVALDLGLLALEFLRGGRFLLLERLDPLGERGIGLLTRQGSHCRLELLALRLELRGEGLAARVEGIDLRLERSRGGLAGITLATNSLQVDNGDLGGRHALCKRRRSQSGSRNQSGSNTILH
jgi:hypothetical protein